MNYQKKGKQMGLDDVRAAAEQAGRSRQQYSKDKDALRAAIMDADRNSEGRNQIAEAAHAGLSRRLVFEVFQVADLLTDAQKAVAAIQGARAFSRSGERVWLAVDDEDLYEPDDRSSSFSIRLTRDGRQAVRAAEAALAKAGLTVADAEPLENGGEAEITRAVAA